MGTHYGGLIGVLEPGSTLISSVHHNITGASFGGHSKGDNQQTGDHIFLEGKAKQTEKDQTIQRETERMDSTSSHITYNARIRTEVYHNLIKQRKSNR